jgi:hypothetical protein
MKHTHIIIPSIVFLCAEKMNYYCIVCGGEDFSESAMMDHKRRDHNGSRPKPLRDAQWDNFYSYCNIVIFVISMLSRFRLK